MKKETCGKCGCSFYWDNTALFGSDPSTEWFSYICPDCAREKAAQARHEEHQREAERRHSERMEAESSRQTSTVYGSTESSSSSDYTPTRSHAVETTATITRQSTTGGYGFIWVAIILFGLWVFLKKDDPVASPPQIPNPSVVSTTPNGSDASKPAKQQTQSIENSQQFIGQRYLGMWENPVKFWGSAQVSRISIIRRDSRLVAFEWGQLCGKEPEPGATHCTVPAEGSPSEFHLVGQENDRQMLFQLITPGYGTSNLTVEPSGENLNFYYYVDYEDPNRPRWAHSGYLERR
jgi:hypothetical protein